MIKKDKEAYINEKLTTAQNTNNDKKIWNTTKEVLGWSNNTAPKLLVHNGVTITKTHEIANTLNREQILRNIRLRRAVPTTNTNPLHNYKKATQHINNKLQLKQINMNKLRSTIDNIKSTGSTGYDQISSRTIKNLQKSLDPLILNFGQQHYN